MVPWNESGRWALAHLPDDYEGEVIPAAAPGSALPPYLREWTALRRRGIDWARYDVVFTWELRTSLALALLRRGAQWRRTKWVALGPILKGPVLKALPPVRTLLCDADRIACFSRAECEEQARLLRLPRERFCFVPSTWPAEPGQRADPNGDYVLALGRSHRDFQTLLKAVREIQIPVVIVAGSPADLRGAGPLPSHVTVRYQTSPAETDALVAGARLHVIPLRPGSFSAGQSVLLRAMARGKAVIVSETAGIRDYVEEGKAARLVPPGDGNALRSALLALWENAEERRSFGSEAARVVREQFSYRQFAERLAHIAAETVCNDSLNAIGALPPGRR